MPPTYVDSSTLAFQYGDHGWSRKQGKFRPKFDHCNKLVRTIDRLFPLHIRPPWIANIAHTPQATLSEHSMSMSHTCLWYWWVNSCSMFVCECRGKSFTIHLECNRSMIVIWKQRNHSNCRVIKCKLGYLSIGCLLQNNGLFLALNFVRRKVQKIKEKERELYIMFIND